MSLIGKFKFLLVIHAVDVLIFLQVVVFYTFGTLSLSLLGADFSTQDGEVGKEFGTVNLANDVDWNVGCFVFKSAVNEDTALYLPTSVSKSLYGLEFVPFRRFRIVNFHWYILAYLVSATTDDHHQRAEEEG